MATRQELERLSSADLADRALDLAKRRMDVRFVWRLLEALPAAEAATGHLEEAESDVQSVLARFNDLRTAEQPDVAEALRPLYIEYLLAHDH